MARLLSAEDYAKKQEANGFGNIMPQLQVLRSLVESTGNKRLLFCVPESAGDIFLCTSLLPSLRENYPGFDIYFACMEQYQDILKGNPHVHKTLPYLPIMENYHMMEGWSDWQGFFDISIMASALTQRYVSYHHNGLDVSSYNFRKEDASD